MNDELAHAFHIELDLEGARCIGWIGAHSKKGL